MSNNPWKTYANLYQDYCDDKGRVSTSVVFPRVLELIGDLAGKLVLDFGCGEGRFSRHLYDLGSKVTGFDPSEPLINIARKLNDGRDITYTSNLDSLPEGNFEIALCFMVLMCNSKSKSLALIQDIFRLTTDDSIICFVNRNTDNLGEKFKDFYSEEPLDRVAGSPYKTTLLTSQGNIEVTDHYYSPSDLRNMYSISGFKVRWEEIVMEQFVIHLLHKI